MYCPKCGSEVDDDAKYCSTCGNDFSSNTQNQNIQTEKTSQNKRSPVITIIAVIGVLFAMVFVAAVCVSCASHSQAEDQIEEAGLLVESSAGRLSCLENLDYKNADLVTVHSEMAAARVEISEAYDIIDNIDHDSLRDDEIDQVYALKIMLDVCLDCVDLVDTDLCDLVVNCGKLEEDKGDRNAMKSDYQSIINNYESMLKKTDTINNKLDLIDVSQLPPSQKADIASLKCTFEGMHDSLSSQKNELESLVQKL